MSFFKKFTKPKSSVSLRLNKNTLNFGDKLEGTLTVSSEEDVDVTEIRAELRCEEKKKQQFQMSDGHGGQHGGDSWQNKTIYREDPQVSGPIHLSTGYRGEFPFSTNLAGGLPSYAGDARTVTWTIKGVIGIKGRPDVISPAAGIQVAAPPTVTMERIVEREVVMIPCDYCGGLFPQTVTICPRCKAPRKA